MNNTKKRIKKLSVADLLLCALFAALIAVGAFIRIPIPVVPFTLQVLFTSWPVCFWDLDGIGFRIGIYWGRFSRRADFHQRGRDRICAASKLWVPDWFCGRDLVYRLAGLPFPEEPPIIIPAGDILLCRFRDSLSLWCGIFLPDQQFLSAKSYGCLAGPVILCDFGSSWQYGLLFWRLSISQTPDSHSAQRKAIPRHIKKKGRPIFSGESHKMYCKDRQRVL